MKNNGPDFICIGAQASGTSWLYRQLKKHPDFKFPNRKEIHYFDRDPSIQKPSGIIYRVTDIFKSSESLLDGLKLLISTLVRKYRKSAHGDPRNYKKDGTLKKEKKTFESDSAYLSTFRSTQITGDITPAYSTLSDARVEQMAKLLPNTKIVFLMRNPIDRNWSAYRKKLKKQMFKEFTLLEMKYFFNQDGVVKRTNYVDAIDRYSSYFGKENILVGFYDAIIDQPDKLLFSIIEFLGGDPTISNPQKHVEKVINESPKSDIPVEVELFLKDKYALLVEELSERYGSYATRWSNDLKGIENRQIELKATVEP